MSKPLIFTFICLFFSLYSLGLITKTILTEEDASFIYLNEHSLLFNMLIDIIITMVNVSFCMKQY